MSLDFDSDVSPKIRFLVDLGIRPDDLGDMLTQNPEFFRLDLGNLKTSTYLITKGFYGKL